MKSLFLLFLLTYSLLSFDYGLEPKRVSKSTYCFFGLSEVMDKHNNGDMSNSCFVNMGTSYLVIDSGPTYQYASQAYEKMKEIKNLPISYVINTHLHDDHWLGNSYYGEKGIEILGSIAFKDEDKVEITRMESRITKEAFKKTTQVYPNIFVKDKKTLTIDATKVEVLHVNKKAHTKSDLLVYIPKFKMLFGGDLIFNDRLPSIRDGNLGGWIEALDGIKSMDLDYIIGGHGKIVDSSCIDFTYGYISELKKGVKSLMEDGYEIGEVVEMLEMKKYKNINFYDSMHRQNVEIAYRMLEWEDE